MSGAERNGGGHARTVVGFVASALLLWWALHDVEFAVVLREIRGADPLLFAIAILVATTGFAIRAARWRLLLDPVSAAPIPFRSRYAATTIGFAANNLLPARIGEFARAWTLSRLAPISFSAVFGTMVVERLLDSVAVIALLAIPMLLPGFPGLQQLGPLGQGIVWAIGTVTALDVLLLWALVVAPERVARLADWGLRRFIPERFAPPLRRLGRGFLDGFAVLRSGRAFWLSLGAALLQWSVSAIAFLLAFRAFGIREAGWSAAFFLQSLISLAVAVPSSPGFFGPFEAASKVGLALWGVDEGKAVSFAIGFHLGGFVPVTVIGLYYLQRLGLRFGEMRVSAADAPQNGSTVAAPAAQHGG